MDAPTHTTEPNHPVSPSPSIIRAVPLALLAALLPARASAAADNIQLGLCLPPGFEVTEFADSKLANDIYTLTVDSRGRVVVSGRGYIRILVDDNADGRADRAINFADGPADGAQGLLWEGSTLYFTGDGGLRFYRDANADDRADGPSRLIRAMKTGDEHSSHAIRRGPDGWLYVMVGNMTGIDQAYAQLPTSPIQVPVGGCLLRFSPDLKASEIVADGFRNCYDMDFNLDGELVTFDSDNERCISLPWYEPTRFYHVIPGGHYGWQSPHQATWWRMPPYFPDCIAPLAYLGRGSPTGVECYRHVQFSEKYRGGIFLLDWTFGRVYFAPLARSGSTYTTKPELFIEATGDNGFAPTDLAVHPATGDLFISIGGRGTRGAVYRIRYPDGFKKLDSAKLAAFAPKRRSLDWQPALGRELIAAATTGSSLDRLRALTSLRRHQARFEPETLEKALLANWGHPDRYVRYAAAELISALPARQRRQLAPAATTPLAELTYGLGACQYDPRATLTAAAPQLTPAATPEIRLAAVRLVQVALGGVGDPRHKGAIWEGYTAGPSRRLYFDGGRLERIDARLITRAVDRLRELFPSGNADLDRELSRTLAMIEDDSPASLEKLIAKLTDDSDPVEDIHYLAVLARVGAPRSRAATAKTARALLALDRKLSDRRSNRDQNWPLRISELYTGLVRRDPGLNAAMLASSEFGRPDHALYALSPGFDRRAAAERFVERPELKDPYAWTPALVELLGALPEDRALPVLRWLFENPALHQAVLPLLARPPKVEDRDRFLSGLLSPYLDTSRVCLEALEALPRPTDGKQLLPLVRALRRLPQGKPEDELRARIADYLAWATGRSGLGADKEAWTKWFTQTYPTLAAGRGGANGVDLTAWHRRLDALNWSSGDPDRGRLVFTKATCVACHSGARALGPDLRGVTGRFSRDDLFTAILEPSRDVPPRYQTTLVATEDGKVYQGAIIYEATDGLILQTGPDSTVRIPQGQISARRQTDTSLMPAGLLDNLTDREIADLYAYLKALKS